MGIEPTLSAWEAEVLPLNYTRLILILLGYHPPMQPDRDDVHSDAAGLVRENRRGKNFSNTIFHTTHWIRSRSAITVTPMSLSSIA